MQLNPLYLLLNACPLHTKHSNAKELNFYCRMQECLEDFNLLNREKNLSPEQFDTGNVRNMRSALSILGKVSISCKRICNAAAIFYKR